MFFCVDRLQSLLYYIYIIQPKECKMSYEKIKEAVIKQLKCDDVQQTFKDVVKGGASGGFGGFIYHNETVKFAKDNIIHIYKYLKEKADEYGVNAFEMVQGFNCLYDIQPTQAEVADTIHGHPDQATINDGVDTQILNALAWYALEEVAFNETET